MEKLEDKTEKEIKIIRTKNVEIPRKPGFPTAAAIKKWTGGNN